MDHKMMGEILRRKPHMENEELRVGDRVSVKEGSDHDSMTKGKSGVIEIVSTNALGIKFDGMKEVHKWYVADELTKK